MSQWPEEFHDPAFRSAILRAEGKPAAPSQLRDKVAALLAAGAAVELSPRPQKRWGLPTMPRLSFRVVAVAAVALIAVGVAVVQIRDFVGENVPHGPTIARMPISVTLASSIVRSHNSFSKLPDPHVLPGDDLKALQQPLSSGAGVSAFSAPLGDGWQFGGACVSPVGDSKAAELLFTRGDEMASVFSMSMGGGDCGPSECFVQMVDHRAVAAVSHEGMLYAVVISQNGAGDPLLADAKGILKTVETSMFGAGATCAAVQPTTSASPTANPPAAKQ